MVRSNQSSLTDPRSYSHHNLLSATEDSRIPSCSTSCWVDGAPIYPGSSSRPERRVSYGWTCRQHTPTFRSECLRGYRTHQCPPCSTHFLVIIQWHFQVLWAFDGNPRVFPRYLRSIPPTNHTLVPLSLKGVADNAFASSPSSSKCRMFPASQPPGLCLDK